MSVYSPQINSVTITPSPVNINSSFLIAVSATDEIVKMYTVSKYSGTSKLGQNINLSVAVEEVTS